MYLVPRVARLAQGSYHPNAGAANAGFGWVEVFFVLPSFFGYWDDLEVPRRPSYYYASAQEVEVEPTRWAPPEGSVDGAPLLAEPKNVYTITRAPRPKHRPTPPCPFRIDLMASGIADEAAVRPSPLDDKPVLAFGASAMLVAAAFLLFELLSRACALCYRGAARVAQPASAATKPMSPAAAPARRFASAPRLLLARFEKAKKGREAKVVVDI